MSQNSTTPSESEPGLSFSQRQKLQVKTKNLVALCVKKQHSLEVQTEIAKLFPLRHSVENMKEKTEQQ